MYNSIQLEFLGVLLMINFCPNCGKRNTSPEALSCSYCNYNFLNKNQEITSQDNTTVPSNLKSYITNSNQPIKIDKSCIICKHDLYSIYTNNQKHVICLTCGIDFIELNNEYYLNSMMHQSNSLWKYYHDQTLSWDKWKEVFEITKFVQYRSQNLIKQNKISENLLKNYENEINNLTNTNLECPYCHEVNLYNLNQKFIIKNYSHLVCTVCGLDLQKNELEENLYLLKDFGNEESLFWIENKYQLKTLNEWITVSQEANKKEYLQRLEITDLKGYLQNLKPMQLPGVNLLVNEIPVLMVNGIKIIHPHRKEEIIRLSNNFSVSRDELNQIINKNVFDIGKLIVTNQRIIFMGNNYYNLNINDNISLNIMGYGLEISHEGLNDFIIANFITNFKYQFNGRIHEIQMNSHNLRLLIIIIRESFDM